MGTVMAPKQWVAFLLASMLLLCVVPHAAQSPYEAAIRALLDRYFAAHAKEDLQAATRIWSEKSPDLASTKTRLKELFSSVTIDIGSGAEVAREFFNLL